MMGQILNLLFGGNRNRIVEAVELFRENSEAAAERESGYNKAALEQFAAEFLAERRGTFDRFMDGLNRVPRPALAFGTLGLFVAAMTDPVWFAARMQGIALVPEPLWWLMGAIVSFYFGARYQVKAQDFRAGLAQDIARVASVRRNLSELAALGSQTGDRQPDEAGPSNAALDEWRDAHE